MKNHLRMSLQIIARAGLSLAVAASIVGQRWQVSMALPVPGVQTYMHIVQEGYRIDLTEDRLAADPDAGSPG
ncbi:MAG: hypothetical protein ABGZ53_32890 [Fuerstiella sp.]